MLTHRCTSLSFPVFSHTVIPPPSPSSSGTGEHYLYLHPVTCLADPYPTQTLLLLCPALVHLSALPPLPLTPRFCFLGFFSILSLAYWKLCASCSVPDICTFPSRILQNLCCQLFPHKSAFGAAKTGDAFGQPCREQRGRTAHSPCPNSAAAVPSPPPYLKALAPRKS